MAVLLINAGNATARLALEYAQVPGLAVGPRGCVVYDVWRRRSLGRVEGAGYGARVAGSDSLFLTLSGCDGDDGGRDGGDGQAVRGQ